MDVYQGAVASLVPFFVAERAYTYATASGIVLAASLLSSVAQPLFGALTDRRALPWLLPVSTVLGGLGIALSGLTGSYPLTLAFVAVSGVGVAAYHPESARVARLASRGSHSAMGWFSLGGNLGFAAAPVLVTAVIATGGLRQSPLLLIPALAGSVLCLPALRLLSRTTTRTPQNDPRTDCQSDPSAPAPSPSPRSGPAPSSITDEADGADEGPWSVGDDKTSFVKLSLAVVGRSVVFIGLSTFLAFYVRQRTGGGPATGTVALCVLYLGGAVGTVLGGSLANRWDRVTVVRRSYLLSVAAVAGVVYVPGPAIYAFVALASAGLYVPFSLQVTLGQDYLPSRMGTASGITLGLTVSIGGLASPLLGSLADATSLRTALSPLILMPVVSWLLFRTLPEPAPPQTLSSAPPTTKTKETKKETTKQAMKAKETTNSAGSTSA
ncbi:MFS transporter [Streptomyces noursei]|uniref:MFS transporter n=1 Tax=Streptomyces noursei TaxID=1971 RepID=UPI0019A51023|nr:MFS transporter [Streptomyces noursei]MCZ1020521.1 MFS transporter [Streptomyces noursei]GGX13126.1 MFS transporter [Streptomyces noursei]